MGLTDFNLSNYNFHRKQSLLKFKMKKLSLKINVKNIKNRVKLDHDMSNFKPSRNTSAVPC